VQGLSPIGAAAATRKWVSMTSTGSADGTRGNDEHAALQQRFKDAMSRVPSTVTVVTTDGPGGRHGVTVSALTSVSAETPHPTLLICLNEKSATAPAILRHGAFCVNVLRTDQAAVADAFAGRSTQPDGGKFTSARWVEDTLGMPQLVDPLVAFSCTLLQSQLVGVHHVIFGSVQSIAIGHDSGALVYFGRRYQTLAPIEAT
jgi:flavin reductase (DIM6/NTAB) family NADH-FMN oxidoreductase RutF